jgi:FMN-dependent NADH-azoreductase
MSTVLVLNNSVLGEASASNRLAEEAIDTLRKADPALRVVRRDLVANPVPHLGADAATAIRGGEPANEAQVAAQALSDTLIAELKAADTLIIGAPMYNFGIPSTLKSWFDHVLRAGVTFRYGANGPEGLVKGKRAIVILSRGGFYSEGPASGMDSQEPHLLNLLRFMGIADVTVVRAEKLAFGQDARDASLSAARSHIAEALDSVVAEAA